MKSPREQTIPDSNERSSPTHILVSGLPRSGTTWLASVLATGANADYVHEPDDEKTWLSAQWFKRGVHRFPSAEEAQNCADYKRLWRTAFLGRSRGRPMDAPSILRRLRSLVRPTKPTLELAVGEKCGLCHITGFRNASPGSAQAYPLRSASILAAAAEYCMALGYQVLGYPKTRVVKSVHTARCLQWLSRTFSVPTIFLLRNPLALVASYKRAGFADALRNLGTRWFPLDNLEHKFRPALWVLSEMGAQIGQIYHELYEDRSQFLILKKYEEVAGAPTREIRQICDQLGLTWTRNSRKAVEVSQGRGAGMSLKRVAEREIDRYESELSGDEIQAVLRGYHSRIGCPYEYLETTL